MAPDAQRLQKLLSSAGFASRRVVEQLIVAERIAVNGEIAKLGNRATVEDDITVDGEPVRLRAELVSYLLNKPSEVLSSASDDRGRTCVTDLIDEDTRLYPIGRLDYETTGLIILTNDGDLTLRLTHPKFGVDKKYVAELAGDVHEADLDRLRQGIELADGLTAPAKIRVLARKADATLVEITIHEGRKRQIRRMAEAIGHEVIHLHRSQIGPISDDSLEPGSSRVLTVDEIHALFAASSKNVSTSNETLD